MANIVVDPNVSPYPYSGGTQQVSVSYDVPSSQVCAATTSNTWISVSIASSSSTSASTYITYNVTVAANTGEYRTGSVVFRCVGSSSSPTTTANMNIIRQGTGNFEYRPLWKDTYYKIYDKTEFEYTLALNSVTVYTGRAKKAPDEESIVINVNKICQDFLHQSISDLRALDNDVVENEGAYGIWSLCDEFGAELHSWVFLCQYDDDWTGETVYNMSEPINGHLDPRMKMMATMYNSGITSVSYWIYEGQSGSFNVTPASYAFAATGGTAEFAINSNLDWNITSYPNWATLSTLSGTGSTTLTVTVSANTSPSETRNGLIVFNSVDGTRTVSLTQAAGAKTLSVDVSALTINSQGGSGTFNVTSNYGWSSSGVSGMDFISILPTTGGSGTTQVTWSALTNSGASRSMTINFYNSDANANVLFYQKEYVSNNVIRYTSVGNVVVQTVPSSSTYTYFGATLTANTNTNGQGRAEFDTNVTKIGVNNPSTTGYGFTNQTKLKTIILPDTVEMLGDYSFKGCTALESITYGTGLTSMKTNVFSGCTSLTEGVIPQGITGVQTGVFNGCTSLTTVKIASSVQWLQKCFDGCSSINEIYAYPGNEPQIESGIFADVAPVGVLHHSAGHQYNNWKAALPSGWTYDTNIND